MVPPRPGYSRSRGARRAAGPGPPVAGQEGGVRVADKALPQMIRQQQHRLLRVPADDRVRKRTLRCRGTAAGGRWADGDGGDGVLGS